MSLLPAARRALAVSFLATLLAACGGRGGPAPAPVGGLTVTPGDGQVVVSWTPDPGVEYWLFYAPATSISTEDLASVPGLRGIINVTSPYLLTGLTNGETYAFTLDGRYDGGPGGAGTPSVAVQPRAAGTSWTAGGAMGSADMRGVAWGGASAATSHYLAVGSTGALYQSSDSVTSPGLTWMQITTSGISAELNAVVYAKGLFLTVGDGGAIHSSADLATWTAGTSVNAQNLHAVASNGSIFVAVGDAGTIETSGDGITWTAAATVPMANNLYGVAYLSSGRWMAAGAGGTLLTSTDASNWTAEASGTTADLRAAAYRPATTTTITIPTTTTTTIPAAYVVVGAGGMVLSSPDGVTWTQQTSNTAADLRALSSVPSQFLAVGSGGAVITSPDGLAWTAQAGTGTTLHGLVNGQGQYVAVGAGGASFYSR
jgi:hypothetical protein